MRAVTVTRPGGPEVLTVADHPVRPARAGEVRIAVKAAAVNPTDILMRQNPDVYATGSPRIPGMDAAGIIESIGDGVERFRVGDEVMAVTTPRAAGGRRADRAAGRTRGLRRGDPERGDAGASVHVADERVDGAARSGPAQAAARPTLAVSGGAGLLAHYATAMAKQRGLRVVADARPSEVELVRSYGADVVVPRGDRFGSEVRAEAPGGVDVLFDTALLGRESFSAIRDGGAYVPVWGWDASPSERVSAFGRSW